jgi:RNA polymerase sigma factor (sigma-70 family)
MTTPQGKGNPLTLNHYDSLSGRALVQHFQGMDSCLWCALSLIAQHQPTHLQKCCLTPIIREVTGTSYGRRWFVGSKVAHPTQKLIEIVRLWIQDHLSWTQFLDELRTLGFYRDTIRHWVESVKFEDERAKEHVDLCLKRYFRFREAVIQAYLPLVWKVASAHGFTEDVRHDLFQIGVTGLLHACERYHNVGPVTFSTFANRWIRQAVLMHISRKLPIIQVSHSVLEEESKLLRKERETGLEDSSPRAQRIKRLSSARDVLLVDELEAEQKVEADPRIDLKYLPRKHKQVVILRYGLLEHAQCDASKSVLDTERTRQFTALQLAMMSRQQETQRRVAQWL